MAGQFSLYRAATTPRPAEPEIALRAPPANAHAAGCIRVRVRRWSRERNLRLRWSRRRRGAIKAKSPGHALVSARPQQQSGCVAASPCGAWPPKGWARRRQRSKPRGPCFFSISRFFSPSPARGGNCEKKLQAPRHELADGPFSLTLPDAQGRGKDWQFRHDQSTTLARNSAWRRPCCAACLNAPPHASASAQSASLPLIGPTTS